MVLAEKDQIKSRKRYNLSRGFGILAFLAILFSGCGEDDKLGVTGNLDTHKMPQLSTRNVSTLISDSGYTKYKVVTPLWNIYSGEGKEAYWDFPEGVYLRQLDHDLEVVSTVAADSAVYFPNHKLWELYGDVEIDQKDKVYFFSQRIFFDDHKKTISSDTFIHIKTPTQVLEGIGFESNQSMTRYRVLKPTGMFPTKQIEGDSNGENPNRQNQEADQSFLPAPPQAPN